MGSKQHRSLTELRKEHPGKHVYYVTIAGPKREDLQMTIDGALTEEDARKLRSFILDLIAKPLSTNVSVSKETGNS